MLLQYRITKKKTVRYIHTDTWNKIGLNLGNVQVHSNNFCLSSDPKQSYKIQDAEENSQTNTHCFPSWSRLWSIRLLEKTLETLMSTIMARHALLRMWSLPDTGSCALPFPPKQKQKKANAPAKLLLQLYGYLHIQIGLDNEAETFCGSIISRTDNSSR